MVQYPQHYHSEAEASAELKEAWESSTSDNKVTCSIPAAYDGSGEAFSPEEFFLLSLQNCFIASFKVYANHKHLEFDRINVSADLIVNVKDDQGPIMDYVEMFIKIYDVKDKNLASSLIDRALKDGFIFNSIRTKTIKNVEFL
jgi:organic hydroperoxide reductase OsmC/OhrA